MSRVGKLPIMLKEGVQVEQKGTHLNFSGKLGKVSVLLNPAVSIEINDKKITVIPTDKADTFSVAMWGTIRSHINNANKGVSEGFSQELDFKGVGYKVQIQGQKLLMTLGYSHEVVYELPNSIKAELISPTNLKLMSAEKRDLGQIVREIQKFRPPEPYKGKGIHKKGEYIYRKEGKKK